MRRSRSNDGHISRVQQAVPLRDSLVIAVLGDELNAKPARQVPRPAEAFSGPKPKGHHPPVKEPDWAILHCRWLKERHGMGDKEIAETMTKLGIEMTPPRAHKICDYQARSHLIPNPQSDGYISEDTK